MSVKFIVLNGTIIEQDKYTEDLTAFYEVIRLKNGVLMFLEDHIKRLNHSLKMANIDNIITLSTVKSDMVKLFEVDGIKDQNVKLSVSVQEGRLICALYYVQSRYLTEDTYKKGVEAKLKSFERENPEIKQLTNAMQAIRKQLQCDSVYEYLLVDREGFILEGTKTNVFFVKGSQVITADTHKALGGITRHQVAGLARAHYGFEESAFAKKNLIQVDAIFLTGTSIGVLPVCKVDDISFNSTKNPVVLSLMKAYETCEKKYIETHQLPNI